MIIRKIHKYVLYISVKENLFYTDNRIKNSLIKYNKKKKKENMN